MRLVFLAFVCALCLAQEDPLPKAIEALDQENYEAAIPLLEQALETRQADIGIRFNLAFALTQVAQDERAIVEYETVLEAKPDLPQALSNLGVVLLRNRRPADAVPHFTKLAELRPDDAQPYYYLGNALAGAGEGEQAIQAFEQAIERDPASAVTHLELGQVLAAKGDWSAAAERYREAVRLDPSLESMLLELADRMDEAGAGTDALGLFQEYLRAHPEEVAVRERIALLLMELKRYQEAIPLLETASKESPSAANQAALAQAYALGEESDKALESWRKAVEAEPQDASLRLRYASELMQQLRYEDAGNQFLAAVKVDQGNVAAWRGLAFSLFQVKNYPAALKALDEGRTLAEEPPPTMYLRALLNDKMRLYEPAKAAYEAFLASKPSMEDEVWKAEQRLKTIDRVLSKR